MSLKDQIKLVSLVAFISLGMVYEHKTHDAAQESAILEQPETVWQKPMPGLRRL